MCVQIHAINHTPLDCIPLQPPIQPGLGAETRNVSLSLLFHYHINIIIYKSLLSLPSSRTHNCSLHRPSHHPSLWRAQTTCITLPANWNITHAAIRTVFSLCPCFCCALFCDQESDCGSFSSSRRTLDLYPHRSSFFFQNRQTPNHPCPCVGWHRLAR